MTRTKRRDKVSNQNADEFRGQILDWYDRHKRTLPWRAENEQKPDPYAVWLSEIMLQQTTVTAVTPYYRKFMDKWPDVQSLADATQDEVMHEWAGLGYYARARNLHACAKVVAYELNGLFPEDQSALKKLPGIGDYTSAAIMAIAFNKPATVVDGNIERIMARYFSVEEPLPGSKPLLKSLASEFFENYEERPGDFAQALMDLGAGVCIAKTPRCSLCPVKNGCQSHAAGHAAELPRKSAKTAKPQKFGYVYWITDGEGRVLLHRRPEKGVLGSMIGLPTSEWGSKKDQKKPAHLYLLEKKKPGDLREKPVSIHHSFTHFDLELRLQTTEISRKQLKDNTYFWVDPQDIQNYGFPTLFKKAVKVFATT